MTDNSENDYSFWASRFAVRDGTERGAAVFRSALSGCAVLGGLVGDRWVKIRAAHRCAAVFCPCVFRTLSGSFGFALGEGFHGRHGRGGAFCAAVPRRQKNGHRQPHPEERSGAYRLRRCIRRIWRDLRFPSPISKWRGIYDLRRRNSHRAGPAGSGR